MWSEAGGGEDLYAQLVAGADSALADLPEEAPRRLIRRLQCSIQKSGQMQKERS